MKYSGVHSLRFLFNPIANARKNVHILPNLVLRLFKFRVPILTHVRS
jgi:hypothetical protein